MSHQLAARMDADRSIDVLGVRMDGVFADVQDLGDFLLHETDNEPLLF